MFMHIHTHTHTHTHTHAHICTCVCVCVYIYICICIFSHSFFVSLPNLVATVKKNWHQTGKQGRDERRKNGLNWKQVDSKTKI